VACDRASPRPARTADAFEGLELVRAKVPTPAKPFAVPDPAGGHLRLGDVTVRLVLLNFWATWCPPCREEMPSMERLYQRYRDREIMVLALSIDRNIDAVAPFVREYRLTFPIGLDPEAAVAGEYGVRALPTTYLIDARRQVVALAMGARDWDGQAARGVVDELLKQGATSRSADRGVREP
jgi:thiol-disulfide isomerase/thioredoxin